MVFARHIPVYPLNQFIESFIYYRDYNPSHSIDRFLPDGNVNAVFDLTDYPKYIYDNESLKEIQACRHIWFSGIRNKFITIPSGKESEMFIINFHKGKAYPFVQMPLDELTDSVVDGDLVLISEIMDLREMILNTGMVSQKFITAEKFLLKKFYSKLIVNPFTNFAVNAIVEAPRNSSIENISAKVGYSQKHLINIFKKNVGITPKSFLKIVRFQKAVEEINRRKKINWTAIALECGYYDHAHFINDFKTFSGFTPNEFSQKQSDYLNYVPIG